MALATRAPLSLLILTIVLFSQARGQNEDLIPIPERWEGFPVITDEPGFPAPDRPIAEMARTPAGAPLSAESRAQDETAAPPMPYVEPAPYLATEPLSEATPVAEADTDCSEFFQDCCGPLWTVYADAIFLHRSTPRNAALITDSFAPGGNELLNAADFKFDTEAGFRLGLVRHNVLDTGWDLEAIYFGIDGWRATTGVVNSPAGAVAQFVSPLGNTAYASDVWASYRSELHNVEVNGRKQVRDWLSILGGFRYLELNENGLSLFQDIGPGLNLVNVSTGATNHLMGFQLGADSRILSRGRLELDCVLKAGIYNNKAKNRAFISQSASPTTFASTASDNHTAFVGEIGLTGLYQLDRGWAIRGGYQLLWIEGVALASDQIAVSDPGVGTATVDTSGSPFYHGAFVGLEFTR